VGEFQGDFDVAAGVEARNRAGGGSEIFMFGVQFVVDIGIKAAEAIVPLGVGYIGADSLGFCVYEVDHAGRHGVFLRVHDAAVYRAELGVILSPRRRDQEEKSQEDGYSQTGLSVVSQGEHPHARLV
jgi:hypothetical protein